MKTERTDSSRLAFVVGTVAGIKEEDDKLLVQLRYSYWDPAARTEQHNITAVFIRDIVTKAGKTVPYKERALKMKLKIGSAVGMVVRFCGEDYRYANGYSVRYDGIETFNDLAENGDEKKYAFVLGVVNSVTEKTASNGSKYVTASVYVGKTPCYDENGNREIGEDGKPVYEARKVIVKTGNERLMERFTKYLNKDSEGSSKRVAFMCNGDPYEYIHQETGAEVQIYTAYNFDITGKVPARK